jgi:hypothetical protein
VPRPSRPRWQSRDRRRSARTRSAETKWRTARERLSCPAGNDGIEETGRGRKRTRLLRVLERDRAQRSRPSVRHMPIRGREGRGSPQTRQERLRAYQHIPTIPAMASRTSPKTHPHCQARGKLRQTNEKALTSAVATARLWRCARRPCAPSIPQASIPARLSIARSTLLVFDDGKATPIPASPTPTEKFEVRRSCHCGGDKQDRNYLTTRAVGRANNFRLEMIEAACYISSEFVEGFNFEYPAQ